MADPTGWRPPSTLPEIAFAGRSNVGKSSLLNRLVGHGKLARVSSTPGRTREVNFFRINDAFVIADLPGYGYARVAKSQRAAWRPLIEGYLERSPTLRGVVLLIDARREPTDDDLAMTGYLAELGAPTLVAITKADKLKPREAAARGVAIARALRIDEEQVVTTSANTGSGRDELAEAIEALLSAEPWRVG
ncbi:MAG: YihA family ribosome biogenesis GTP-binding protein [Gemmatimonadetes bacterium]|nr:YihA family ribosome biogenesis GTP-binding protein [Gemmatimonadota bacterium]